MTFFGLFNKSKRSQSAQTSSGKSLGRTTSANASPSSSRAPSLRERLSRPKVHHAKTAPPQPLTTHEEPQGQVGARNTFHHGPAPRKTALNAFKFTLSTLSSASEILPAPGFRVAIDILLAVMDGIQVGNEMLTSRVSYKRI